MTKVKSVLSADGRYHFDIPIGDWSGDGHNSCEYYQASAAKPFVDVCKAFVAARKLWKLEDGSYFTIESICSEYGDSSISDEDIEFLESKGFSLKEKDFWTQEMAELVVWFLNQGDPSLDAKLQPEGEVRPILRNWDFCEALGKKTNDTGSLDQFGYGFFE